MCTFCTAQPDGEVSVLLNIFRECKRYGRECFLVEYTGVRLQVMVIQRKTFYTWIKILPIKQLFPIINIINVYEQNLIKKLSKLIKVPPFTQTYTFKDSNHKMTRFQCFVKQFLSIDQIIPWRLKYRGHEFKRI